MLYDVGLFHTPGEQTVYLENSGADKKKAKGQTEVLKISNHDV